MITAIFSVTLLCAPTQIINETNRWTKRDTEILKFNRDFCKKTYKRSVCLKYFIKRAELNHAIICVEKEQYVQK